jgi:NhaP-type Na+/H+ or K+/H+ antiporter
MNIKWTALAEVALVSFGAAISIVVIFAVGVLAWSLRTQITDEGTESPASGRSLPTAAAALCFFACALIVCYGIYLIVPQFH